MKIIKAKRFNDINVKSVPLQSTESNFGVTLQRRRRRGGTCVSGGEHSCVKKQWIFNK